MNNYYVYGHFTKDTNELFYVGKGKNRRAFEKRSRNRFWKNVAEKHGFTVVFIGKDLSESVALELEIETIATNKPKCNLTNGGQGTAGYVFDEELVRMRNKANKERYSDPKWVAKRTKSLTEAMARPEVREKLVNFQSRKRDEVAAGVRPKAKGPRFSPEAIKRISDKQKGDKGFWYGKTTAVARAVTNLTSNETFPSLRLAAESVGGNYRVLLRAIKSGKTYKKQMFAYVKEKQ